MQHSGEVPRKMTDPGIQCDAHEVHDDASHTQILVLCISKQMAGPVRFIAKVTGSEGFVCI